jgi:hypothetical protein
MACYQAHQPDKSQPASAAARPRPPLFRALGGDDPPAEIEIDGQAYWRVEIFKHDSWAATALYRGADGLIVCKFNRSQPILGMPMAWLGRFLACREARFLHKLAGLRNVPNPCGTVCVAGKPLDNAVAHRFVPGHPLGARELVCDDFFPALRKLLTELHRRGIAYMDLHKRENILVGEDGQPHLIDFQVCCSLDDRLHKTFPVLGEVMRLFCQADRYHLYKHVAKLRPDQCDFAPADLDAVRPWWIKLHRLLAVPFRSLRRQLLVLFGVRTGKGRAHSESHPEDAVRRELAQTRRAA